MTYKAYFIDLDGTRYRGKERIPEAEAFVQRLQAAHLPFLFVTNNATRTPDEVAMHVYQLCGLTIDPAQVYTSGLATIDYLKEYHTDAKILAISEQALKSQLSNAGFSFEQERPTVVIQSLDRQCTYSDLEQATLAIRGGAPWITTNIDSNLPSEKGLVPGSGALMAFLKTSTATEPIVIGKPSGIIMEGALQHLNRLYPTLEATIADVVMVGDNYNTDILAGIHVQMDTLMVLTGYTTRADLANQAIQPTHLVESLADWSLDDVVF